MATTKKAAKPTVTIVSKPKPKTTKASTKPATKSTATKTSSAKTTKPATKPATKAATTKTAKPTVTVVTKQKPKAASSAKTTKPASKAATTKTAKPVKVDAPKKASTKGTVYHVSKRENNGREWKVFIEKSSKPIKIFDTQAEALDFAKGLANNKDDGSYVVLHGLDGKIRKF